MHARMGADVSSSGKLCLKVSGIGRRLSEKTENTGEVSSKVPLSFGSESIQKRHQMVKY